jgi:hypothetical protein
MLTKKEIDDFFVSEIPQMKNMIEGVKKKKMKEYITTDAALNEAYIHISCLAEIKDYKHLQSILINYLNKSLIWTNSRINKLEKVTAHNDKISYFNEFDGDTTDDSVRITKAITTNTNREDEGDRELLVKIELELWWNEKQSVLQMYRQQEKDKQKQIIFDCFFKKKITKGVDLAKHLMVNKDYGCAYIRVLKADIRDYYNKIQYQ